MFSWNNDAHNYSNDKIERMSINTLTSSQSREDPVSGLCSGPISSSGFHLSFQLFSSDESAPRAPQPHSSREPSCRKVCGGYNELGV